MEQIGHGIDEYYTRLLPANRLAQGFWVDRNRKSAFVFFGPHRLQPLRHPFGIAMLAAMADLRATGHRIPRSLSPFDFGACGHIILI